MPLIVLTGYPASGKSTRAYQLKEYFTKADKTVVIVSENDIAKNRSVYAGENSSHESHI